MFQNRILKLIPSKYVDFFHRRSLYETVFLRSKKKINNKMRGTDFGGDYPRTTRTHYTHAAPNTTWSMFFVSFPFVRPLCYYMRYLYNIPTLFFSCGFPVSDIYRMFSPTLTATVVYTLYVVILYAYARRVYSHLTF